MGRELAELKDDANHWLTDPEYAALKYRLEHAHAAVVAALVETTEKPGRSGRGKMQRAPA